MRVYGISGFLATALLALFSHAAPAHADCAAPDGVLGEVRYNEDSDIFQGCTSRGWVGFNAAGDPAPSGPTGCNNIGEACSDGTIYAGLSPDGNAPMYAVPTDASGSYTWDDGLGNSVDTPMENCTTSSSTATSCTTGRTNTTLLAAITGASPAPYKAAQYCENLTANGYSDWYLPALNELALLYAMHSAGQGGFSASYYWASSEYGSPFAWTQNFANGAKNGSSKNSTGPRVRCVRR